MQRQVRHTSRVDYRVVIKCFPILRIKTSHTTKTLFNCPPHSIKEVISHIGSARYLDKEMILSRPICPT